MNLPDIDLSDEQLAELDAAERRRCPFCGGCYQILTFAVAHEMVEDEVVCQRYMDKCESPDEFVEAVRSIQ